MAVAHKGVAFGRAGQRFGNSCQRGSEMRYSILALETPL